ncbi:hypothetical protein [Maridesulfovibrio sp.]|uniref:capsular polysaccharide export protein, LipB/KpsS family n=1 Tax=Maridesulfovibrio sp. TaxID=2795000 RepID=UPI002A18B105|nr:hypothetical protein [Maridesulfovibrio sp.]
MDKPTILFLGRGRRDVMFIETIEGLKDKYNIVVLAPDESREKYKSVSGITVEEYLSQQELEEACANVTDAQLESVYKIEKELGVNCYEFNINYMLYRKFVSRYGAPNLHHFLNNSVPQRLVLFYDRLTEIIDKYGVSYVFYETIDMVDSMILNAMASKGRIKAAFEHSVESLGGELRLRLATGQHRRSKKIDYVFNSCEISEGSESWARQATALYDKQKPDTKYDAYHAKMGSIIPKFSFQQLLDKGKRVLNGETFLPALLKTYNRICSNKYFSRSLPEEKILSYFLQLTPEASMCSQVPEFADQEYLIEQIAIHGKYGYTIAVKEHPACFGNRLPRFYQELSLLPNVVLLPPSFPTRDLILKSEAIIVASGTTPGLESIATGVPVICLGNPYFNISKNTVSCEKPEEVWKALETIEYREEERHKFIAAMHQATYEHPQFDTPEDFELGLGIGKVMSKALDDEITLYESGVLK